MSKGPVGVSLHSLLLLHISETLVIKSTGVKVGWHLLRGDQGRTQQAGGRDSVTPHVEQAWRFPGCAHACAGTCVGAGGSGGRRSCSIRRRSFTIYSECDRKPREGLIIGNKIKCML